MANLADYLLAVESKETPRIQEAHILAGHMLCDWIELESISGMDQKSTEANDSAALTQVERAR